MNNARTDGDFIEMFHGTSLPGDWINGCVVWCGLLALPIRPHLRPAISLRDVRVARLFNEIRRAALRAFVQRVESAIQTDRLTHGRVSASSAQKACADCPGSRVSG